MTEKNQGKTSTGMEANVAALLSYLLGFVTGIIFYVIEKDNKFVRFHAMQSMITFGGLFVVNAVLTTILGTLGFRLAQLLSLLGFALWIILMIKAYQGELFKLPVVGDIAEKNSK
jgi:uncharacterized membrane protein